MSDRFTEEELSIAKSVDLVEVARSLGYTPKKIGRFYTLKEMDSMRIYDHRNWFRFSGKCESGRNGGSQIDFLREFAGLDVKDAVFWLLDFAGVRHDSIGETVSGDCIIHNDKPVSEKKEFILPVPASNNDRIIRYLNQDRGLSISTIDYFIRKGIIYESQEYHNVVFLGNDKSGVTRFASQRGIYDRDGKAFKCDVAGNDKMYGFNITNDNSNRIVVFEAAIDMMSYVDIFQDFDSNMIALGMTADLPLETFLSDHPGISKIEFALDNDEPGRLAAEKLIQKYRDKGYEVKDASAPVMYKDINEWLVATRLKLSSDSVAERKYEYLKSGIPK